MKLEYYDKNKLNWFLVTWDLGDKCNYRCSYCPKFLHDGVNGWPSLDRIKTFIDSLSTQTVKQICYRFSGGEPTYYKDFIKVAEYIHSKNQYFTFLSNGSRDIEYWNNIKDYVDGLMLSYHEQYSNLDHFINISKTLDCPVIVNLMMVPEKFDTLLSHAEYLYNNSNMAIWPKLILDKTVNKDNLPLTYTTEQLNIINNWKYFRKLDDSKIHRGDILFDNKIVNANDLIVNNQNNFYGYKCYNGIDQINVGLDGTVYRSDCMYGGSIGTIDSFKLPTEPIICGKHSCHCLSDIYIRKEM